MRLGLGSALCLAPLGALWWGEVAVATSLGNQLAAGLSAAVAPYGAWALEREHHDPFASVVAVAVPLDSADPANELELAEQARLDEGELAPVSTATAKSKGSKSKARRRQDATALPAIRVPARTVLSIANSGRRPSGIPVVATVARPAGIQVAQTSALGIGVRDGDVLTDVGGVAVTTVGQVVSLVIAARGARQPVIEGRLWRGGRSYAIYVEQPYLNPPREPVPTPVSTVAMPATGEELDAPRLP